MSEKQKICIISFDHWSYDKEIVKALNHKNVIVTHINFGKYKYRNIFERLGNTLCKVFLNKNPKHFKRQNLIIEKLKNLGKQNQILVLNPDLIDLDYHFEIKKYTNRYIAYLYDSITRSKMPIEHLLEGIFDEIYSFDSSDVEKYRFIKTNNYIYTEKQKIKQNHILKTQVLNISSFDKRFETINKIANKLSELNISFKFVLINKTIFFKILNYKFNRIFNSKKYPKINSKIIFQPKRISLENLKKEYLGANIILDLVQENQSGLSFRVFEAMALEKKLITNNQSIKDYDFYNSNNILVVDDKLTNIEKDFFETEYLSLNDKIFDNYTVEKWVERVFEI